MADPDKPAGQPDEEEAERILRQVERDSQSIVFGGMPASAPADAGREASRDPVEEWGRRIGRGLAVIAAIAAVFRLVATLA